MFEMFAPEAASLRKGGSCMDKEIRIKITIDAEEAKGEIKALLDLLERVKQCPVNDNRASSLCNHSKNFCAKAGINVLDHAVSLDCKC